MIASSALPRGLPSAWEWRKKPQMAGAGWGVSVIITEQEVGLACCEQGTWF